jgi:PAS domain-containing protein
MEPTDHKGAEEALRVSEERFRTLLQFSFDVYWETDAQHRLHPPGVFRGPRRCAARGSEIGKTRWEVLYLEPDEEAWREHRASSRGRRPQVTRATCRSPDCR